VVGKLADTTVFKDWLPNKFGFGKLWVELLFSASVLLLLLLLFVLLCSLSRRSSPVIRLFSGEVDEFLISVGDLGGESNRFLALSGEELFGFVPLGVFASFSLESIFTEFRAAERGVIGVLDFSVAVLSICLAIDLTVDALANGLALDVVLFLGDRGECGVFEPSLSLFSSSLIR
jgi:hypothetical protein